MSDHKNSSGPISASKSYASSGVSLEVADNIADRITTLLPKTFRKGCIPLPGGFAGLFDPKREGLEDSILVMSTDGVGTKIKLGIQFKAYRGLGVDLVAMSVNDIITLGAQPLCFLDYVAFGKIDKEILMNLVEGIVDGCQQSECALIGGETAEMPGMYKDGDFDLAGFCVGAVGRNKVVDGKRVQSGDVIVALPSSGVHSNGYSLVRSIVNDAPATEVAKQEKALIAPTRIYAKQVKQVCAQLDVKGMAHITGGGIVGNVTRVIPEGLMAEMQWGSWQIPPVFTWLQKQGNVAQTEMLNVFNMGVGYTFIVSKQDEAALHKLLGDEAATIGVIREIKSNETNANKADEIRACIV